MNELVSDAMLDAVRAGTLDAAMVVQREHVPMTGLASQPFITEPYDLAVAESHALAQRTAVRLGELAEEPFVLHRPGSAVRDQILHACADAGFRPRIALETGEMSAARAFVAAGLGITVLPRSSLASAGPAVRILALRPTIHRTSILVWPQKGPRSAAAAPSCSSRERTKNCCTDAAHAFAVVDRRHDPRRAGRDVHACGP